MTYEDFVEFGKDADVWIWPSPSAPPLDDTSIFTDEVKNFKAYVNQQVYYPGGSVGWFDQAYIQPDVLIEDFCDLAGTLDLESGEDYQRKWFRNVFTNDVNTPNPTCEDLGGIDTPRETAGSDCAIRTAPPTRSSTTSPTKASTESPTTSPTKASTESPTTSPTKAPVAEMSESSPDIPDPSPDTPETSPDTPETSPDTPDPNGNTPDSSTTDSSDAFVLYSFSVGIIGVTTAIHTLLW
jgi:hypothetical protein